MKKVFEGETSPIRDNVVLTQLLDFNLIKQKIHEGIEIIIILIIMD